MNSREFFCGAREAVQRLRGYADKIEAKRQLAVIKARAEGPSARGGVTDPSRRIDELMDFEAGFERDKLQLAETVAEAEAVVSGLRQIDPGGAAVIRARYINAMPWADICEACGMEYGEVRAIESAAHDLIDSEGMAAVKMGRRSVTAADWETVDRRQR